MKNVIPAGLELQEVAAAVRGEQRTERSADAPSSGIVVGDVLDTHHPLLPGRVLVRWLDYDVRELEDWLEPERHLSLVKGDRVLVTRPAGWREWIVTGALGRCAEPAPTDTPGKTLRLEPGESLAIQAHDGSALLTLHQGAQGPRLEVAAENLEISAKRTLKLSAQTIELISTDGGLELRSEGEAVVRAKLIRLN